MVISVGVITVIFYEKEIINSFTQAANKYLKTKIDAEIEGLTLLDKFPQASISMKNVKIHGSLPDHKEKLAEIEQIHFTISLIDLIRKEYNINAIYLEEGFINLHVDENGKNNYTFMESNPTDTSTELNFNIQNIILHNIQINYEDISLEQHHRLYAHNLDGELSIKNATTTVKLKSNCDIEHFGIGENKYLENKQMKIVGNVLVNTERKIIDFPLLKFTLSNSNFLAEGKIKYDIDNYGIHIKSDKTDFKTLLSLLPNSISENLKSYKSSGKTSFLVSIVKKGTALKNAKINITFGCKNVSLVEPNTNKTLKNLSFSGKFTNGRLGNLTSSSLILKDINGAFEGHPFKGQLLYENFATPHINTYLNGKFPIHFLLNFTNSNQLKSSSGYATVDLKLKAFQKDLESNNTSKITSSGKVILEKASFRNQDNFYDFQNLNGNFVFNKNDIAISNFTGVVNDSDFKINGFLKGFFSYFFSDKGKLLVNADLNSNSIDFDRLIESSHKQDTASVEMDNSYLKNIQFHINAKAKKVKWGKFNFKNTTGDVRLNDFVFTSPKIQGEIGDGRFNVHGRLNTREKDNTKLSINTKIDGIKIDSIFYFFNDFNEDFITHENISGSVFLQSSATMHFNKYLDLKPSSLIADMDISIKEGRLKDFEPMQNLSTFINERQLRDINFSELHNIIHIENEKIEIPEMRINSSVSNISLRGSHTFDQKMYYKLKVPLRNLKFAKRNEAQTAFEDGKDGPTVHLIISGTADDFAIKYDKEATGEIIKKRVKDEIQDVKDVIKGIYEEPEEEQIILEEDEFFEFEEDTLQ